MLQLHLAQCSESESTLVREIAVGAEQKPRIAGFLALLAGRGLAAAAVAPLAFSSPAGHAARDGAIALSAYFVSVSIAPFFGWFPVPLVGLGMSFPVGFWLGMGLLVVISRVSRTVFL